VISGTATESSTSSIESPPPIDADGTRLGRVVDFWSPVASPPGETEEDIDAAQALRYRIFYEVLGARPLPHMLRRRRDVDRFDNDCDHLLVLDHARGGGHDRVVGTYRLLRRKAAAGLGGFYSAAEYDIAPLVALPGEILELGRSCVDAAYRQRPAMQLLWSGIAGYVSHHGSSDVRLREPSSTDPGAPRVAAPHSTTTIGTPRCGRAH
jgi:hypothetical protein